MILFRLRNLKRKVDNDVSEAIAELRKEWY